MKKLILLLLISCLNFVLYGQQWNEVQKIQSSHRHYNQMFGYKQDLDGNYLAIGTKGSYDQEDINEVSTSGEVYIFEKDTTNSWIEVQKLTPDSQLVDGFFGYSVSISNNYLAVGYPENRIGPNGYLYQNWGSVNIYKRDSLGYWNFEQALFAENSNDSSQYRFGRSVSLSGDFLAVGSMDPYSIQVGEAPLVHIFKKGINETWDLFQEIELPSGIVEFEPGFEAEANVKILGEELFIGLGDDILDENGENPVSNSGSILYYTKDSLGNFEFTQKLVRTIRLGPRNFGYNFSVWGNSIIEGDKVEGYNENEENYAPFSGAAYIFEKDSLGLWTQTQKIVASDRNLETASFFGYAVAIDSNIAIITAWDEDKDELGENPINNAGAAYFFERNEFGEWNEIQKIVASDREVQNIGLRFGATVSIDNGTVVVGKTFDYLDLDFNNYIISAGAAYIFEFEEIVNVEEISKVDGLDFYPNPTSGPFTINLPDNFDKGSIIIRNILGVVISKDPINGRRIINGFIEGSKGLYIIEVTNNDHVYNTFKIIKRD